jgi:leader peptidase (prepilin peptidase)/N-methyltransferase
MLASALTALGCGVVVLALLPWARRFVPAHSAWLRPVFPVLLALLGGWGASVLAHGPAEAVAFGLLVVACALLVPIDLAALRLPDRIVGPAYPLVFGALAVAAAVEGDWSRLGRAAIGAVVLLIVYLVLALITPSGLGLGDVKLSGVLGGFLAWLGWPQLLLGVVAGFAVNALVSLVLLVVGKAKRGGELPFGPWMVAGAAIGAALGPLVFSNLG